MDSLQEEWIGVYPKVGVYLECLRQRPSAFKVSDLSQDSLQGWLYKSLFVDIDFPDPLVRLGRKVFFDGSADFDIFRNELLDALYVVGAIGIKVDGQSPIYWSFYSDHRLGASLIHLSSVVHVHSTFWRTLGIRIR